MSKLIPEESSTGYQLWNMPDVTPLQNGAAGVEPQRIVRADQIELIQQQAYEEAYARGYKEGLSAGQEVMRNQVQRFSQLATKLNEPLNNLDADIETELLKFIIAISRLIIRRELTINPENIIAVVKESLALLPVSCRNVKVCLCPEDAQLVRDILNEGSQEPGWKIIEDPSLSKGGCRVLTDTSHIDATIEKRIGEIAAALLGGTRDSDG